MHFSRSLLDNPNCNNLSAQGALNVSCIGVAGSCDQAGGSNTEILRQRAQQTDRNPFRFTRFPLLQLDGVDYDNGLQLRE